MQFARQVIMASTSSTIISDQKVMRLIAVVITTVICLLLYFSTATGRRINRYLAWLKIGLMITVFVAGAVKAGRNKTSVMNEDMSRTFDLTQSNSATALLNVLFSFQGWENATLVGNILFCREGRLLSHTVLSRLPGRFQITRPYEKASYAVCGSSESSICL